MADGRRHDVLGAAAEWGLRVAGPVRDGRRSSLPVETAAGEPALLEVVAHPSPYEHLALRAWAGRGAVRLLRADPRRGWLLTERTDPDHDLRNVPVVEACVRVAALYAELHRAPLPQPPTLAEELLAGRHDLVHPSVAAVVPRRFADQVASWAPGLVDESEVVPVLLHGDLHYGTVRAAQREPWLAVAPRPLTGDPAYEVAPLLTHRWAEAVASGDVRGAVLDRFYAVVDAAELDEERARAWVVVRVLVELAVRVQSGHADPAQVTKALTVVKAVQR